MRYKSLTWYEARKKMISKASLFEKKEEQEAKESDEKTEKSRSESFKKFNIFEPEEANPQIGSATKASSVLDEINKSLESNFKDLKKTIQASTKGVKDETDVDVTGIFGDQMGKRMLSIGSWLSGDSQMDFDENKQSEREMKYASLVSKFFGVSPGVTGSNKQGSSEFKVGEDIIEKVVDFPNGGVNRENQKIFYEGTVDRLKSSGQTELSSFIGTLKAPDFERMGQQKYFESTEYTRKMEELGVFSNNPKALFSYFSKLGLTISDSEIKESFVVCLRQTRKIKNLYSNSFSDIFFLVDTPSDSSKITVMLGSSTPSPIFRYKKGFDFLVGAVGLRGLIAQSKPFIIGPGKIEFGLDDRSNKRKFYGTDLLKNKGTAFKQYLYPLYDSESTAKTTASYKPDFGNSFEKSVSICPSIPGGTSEFLDACTSGDIVIQRYQDYKKILNAAIENGGKIKMIILEDVDSKESVNESLKYIKPRNF